MANRIIAQFSSNSHNWEAPDLSSVDPIMKNFKWVQLNQYLATSKSCGFVRKIYGVGNIIPFALWWPCYISYLSETNS